VQLVRRSEAHAHEGASREDNSELVSLLKKGLSHGGFSADSVGTAADAVHVLATMRYAAIVLDLGCPTRMASPARDIRRRGDSTPVLVLTRATESPTASQACARAPTTTCQAVRYGRIAHGRQHVHGITAVPTESQKSRRG